MKEVNKLKKNKKLLSALLSVVLIAVAGLSAYAYQKYQISPNKFIMNKSKSKFEKVISEAKSKFDKENDFNKKLNVLKELQGYKDEIAAENKDKVRNDFEKTVKEMREKLSNDLKDKINVVRKGNKVDTVIITKSALDRLNEYITSLPFTLNREDYVFISKNKTGLSIRAIQKLVMKYTDAFNVPMSPHKLRHSYGTKLALKTNGNIPIIMTQMGHSNSDTSMLYINESKKIIKQNIDKLDD